MMDVKKERLTIVIAGLATGVIAAGLAVLGNPANMGFCIACFLRDISGALGLHQAAAVQYIRPEIPGLVLGSLAAALWKKEFTPRGGSAPVTRFFLGGFVMIGCLMFLGCPLRMILRLAGGDGNALPGLAGFGAGILAGVFFLNRGYSLKRTYKQPAAEGWALPAAMAILLVLLAFVPGLLHFTESGCGPGALHAALWVSLGAGLAVGALAQRTRLCMVGGIRDMLLFREPKLLLGFGAILLAALAANAALGLFHPGFAEQPVSHSDGLWNALGMFLAGYGCVLLGGCPLRQLVLSGEGNADSAAAVLGLMAGAAFAHNFGLASSSAGPTEAGKIAVILGIAAVSVIACVNTFGKKQ